MPELPEVETVRRLLESRLLGRVVARVRLSGLPLRRPVPPRLVRGARGRTITGVDRHGKFLLVELSGGAEMVAHLGMTGKYLLFERAPKILPRHVHATFAFTDGSAPLYHDARRF